MAFLLLLPIKLITEGTVRLFALWEGLLCVMQNLFDI